MNNSLWQNYAEVFNNTQPLDRPDLQLWTTQNCCICQTIPGVQLEGDLYKRNGISWRGNFNEMNAICSYCAITNYQELILRFWVPTSNGMAGQVPCVFSIYTLTGNDILRLPMP